VDARRAPKWVLDVHLPDQRAQLRLYLWPTSPSTRFPTPVAAKARPVPTQERLGRNDPEHLQGRWKPAIQPNKEPSIMVRQPNATMHPAPQDNQLMSKHRVLGFKPQLRLEWRGHDGQDETEQPDHSASLGDSVTSSTRIGFLVRTAQYNRTHRPWRRLLFGTFCAQFARSSTTKSSSPSPHCPRRCRSGSSNRRRPDRPSTSGTVDWCIGYHDRNGAAAHPVCRVSRSPSPGHR
jgi:hypothetical protein